MDYTLMNKRALKDAAVAAILKGDAKLALEISQEIAKRGATQRLSVVKDEKAKVFSAIEADWQKVRDSFEDVSAHTLESALSLDGGPTADNPTGLSRQTRIASQDRDDGFRVVVMIERTMAKDSEGKLTSDPVNTVTAWNRPESEDEEHVASNGSAQ